MQVEAFLADSLVAVGGKLFGLGIGFDQVVSQEAKFPLVYPSLAVGLVIHVPYQATNHMHSLEVTVEDADAHQLVLNPGGAPSDDSEPQLALGGDFNVGRPPMLDVGDEQVICIALNFVGLSFPLPGRYSIVTKIDHAEMSRLPLRVKTLDGVSSR